MKNLIALLLALPLVACSGDPFQPIDPPPASTETLVSSAPAQLLLLHGCDDAGCSVAARHPARPTLRCADGQELPSCPVRAIEWPGLASSEDLEALALAPRGHERLAVQGRFRPDGALDVVGVALRAGSDELPGRLLRASVRGCDEGACRPVALSPLDDQKGWSNPWLDVSQAPGDEVAHNLLLAAAYEPAGALVFGQPRGRGKTRRFEVRDYFAPVPLAPSLCGDELREALAQASAGLLWPSESDVPIEPFMALFDGEGPLDEAHLLAMLSQPPGTAIESRAMVAFDHHGRNAAGMSPEEHAQAARFRALRAVLESNLTGVASFYLGQIDVRVLVVGRSRCGELAGIETRAIET